MSMRCDTCGWRDDAAREGMICCRCLDAGADPPGEYVNVSDGDNLIGCRPVTLDLNDPIDAGCVMLTIYTGSTQVDCDVCGRKVWLAPRCRAEYEAHGGVLACFPCLARHAAAGGRPARIINLGNEEGNLP